MESAESHLFVTQHCGKKWQYNTVEYIANAQMRKDLSLGDAALGGFRHVGNPCLSTIREGYSQICRQIAAYEHAPALEGKFLRLFDRPGGEICSKIQVLTK